MILTVAISLFCEKKKGFTFVEALMAAGLVGLVFGVALLFIELGASYFRKGNWQQERLKELQFFSRRLTTDLANASHLVTVSYGIPDGTLISPQPINILKADNMVRGGSILLFSAGGRNYLSERQIMEFNIAKIDSTPAGGEPGYNMYCAVFQKGGEILYMKRWVTPPAGQQTAESPIEKQVFVRDVETLTYRYSQISSEFEPSSVIKGALTIELKLKDPSSPSMAPIVYPLSVEVKVPIQEVPELPTR